MVLAVSMFSKEDEFPWGLTTLISYPPPSLPLPAAPPGLLQAGPCPVPELIGPGKGPAWRQATRWSLATIEPTPWEPRPLCAQDLGHGLPLCCIYTGPILKPPSPGLF